MSLDVTMLNTTCDQVMIRIQRNPTMKKYLSKSIEPREPNIHSDILRNDIMNFLADNQPLDSESMYDLLLRTNLEMFDILRNFNISAAVRKKIDAGCCLFIRNISWMHVARNILRNEKIRNREIILTPQKTINPEYRIKFTFLKEILEHDGYCSDDEAEYIVSTQSVSIPVPDVLIDTISDYNPEEQIPVESFRLYNFQEVMDHLKCPKNKCVTQKYGIGFLVCDSDISRVGEQFGRYCGDASDIPAHMEDHMCNTYYWNLHTANIVR